VGFFIQFGYPGETWEDIQQTLRMIRDCRPDDIGISVSYPLPGTPFYQRVKSQLGMKQNWTDSQDLAMLYQGPFSTRFYRQLHRVVHKEFRLHRNHAASTFIKPGSHNSHYPSFLKRFRRKLRPSFDRMTLQADRVLLKFLSSLPHRQIVPLAPVLDREDAATPTPQERHEESFT
jgi:radical SAM superfamily enzyme YgiQ (UPF0313 family)